METAHTPYIYVGKYFYFEDQSDTDSYYKNSIFIKSYDKDHECFKCDFIWIHFDNEDDRILNSSDADISNMSEYELLDFIQGEHTKVAFLSTAEKHEELRQELNNNRYYE